MEISSIGQLFIEREDVRGVNPGYGNYFDYEEIWRRRYLMCIYTHFIISCGCINVYMYVCGVCICG
jgi:hypothetical protein